MHYNLRHRTSPLRLHRARLLETLGLEIFEGFFARKLWVVLEQVRQNRFPIQVQPSEVSLRVLLFCGLVLVLHRRSSTVRRQARPPAPVVEAVYRVSAAYSTGAVSAQFPVS